MEIAGDIFANLKSFSGPGLQQEMRAHGKVISANKGDVLIKEGQWLDLALAADMLKP
jgi:CRP/FNR family transcriptional regulator